MKISSVLDYNAKSEETSYGGSSSSMQEESLRWAGTLATLFCLIALPSTGQVPGNHTNFAPPLDNRNIFDSVGPPIANAGLITSTQTAARQIQFALKVIW